MIFISPETLYSFRNLRSSGLDGFKISMPQFRLIAFAFHEAKPELCRQTRLCVWSRSASLLLPTTKKRTLESVLILCGRSRMKLLWWIPSPKTGQDQSVKNVG